MQPMPPTDHATQYAAAADRDPARKWIARQNPARTVSRLARILAGSFYRAAAWPEDARPSSARVGLALSTPGGAPGRRVYVIAPTVAGTSHPGGTSGATVPGLLLDWASTRPTRAERADALDLAAEALGGLACLVSSSCAALCRPSPFGFGATYAHVPEWTEAAAADAWHTDEQRAQMRRASDWTGPQRRAADLAREILARQLLAEAADVTMHPMERARRVTAAARLRGEAPSAADCGGDEVAERLAAYAERHTLPRGAWGDSSGADAWQTFRTTEDEQRDEQSKGDNASTGARMEEARQVRRAAETANAGEQVPEESRAEETPTEAGERQEDARGAEQRRGRAENPSGKAKPTAADKRSTEADEAADLANRCAHTFDTGGADSQDGDPGYVTMRLVIM